MAGWRDHEAKTSGGMRDLKSLFWTLKTLRVVYVLHIENDAFLGQKTVRRSVTEEKDLKSTFCFEIFPLFSCAE